MYRQRIQDPNSLEERIRKQEQIVMKKKEAYDKAQAKLDRLLEMRKRRREAVKKRIMA